MCSRRGPVTLPAFRWVWRRIKPRLPPNRHRTRCGYVDHVLGAAPRFPGSETGGPVSRPRSLVGQRSSRERRICLAQKNSWVWSNSPWTLLITFPNAANTTPDISLKSHTTTPHGSTSNMHAPAAPAVRGRRRGGGGGGNRPARRVRNSPGRSNDCPILHGASSAPLGHLLRLDAVFGYHVAPLTLLWGLGRRGRRTLCQPTGYL